MQKSKFLVFLLKIKTFLRNSKFIKMKQQHQNRSTWKQNIGSYGLRQVEQDLADSSGGHQT